MKNKQKGFTILELLTVVLYIAAVGGWGANIVKLASTDFDAPITIRVILRGMGIPVVPLGVVMGYL